VSSAAANLGLRKKCLRVLREVSSAHGFLPKSYSLSGVTLSDTAPYACGGFAGTWKGQQDENQVCVKAFLPREAAGMDKIKRVCDNSKLQRGSDLNLIPIRGSTTRL
jgi:hypothetical protein